MYYGCFNFGYSGLQLWIRRSIGRSPLPPPTAAAACLQQLAGLELCRQLVAIAAALRRCRYCCSG